MKSYKEFLVLCSVFILTAAAAHADYYPSDAPLPGMKAPPVTIAPAPSTNSPTLSLFDPKLPSAPISSLVVTTLAGKPIDLAAVPGVKVIYFFSIGCPCVRDCEDLTYKPLFTKYGSKIAFYAVTSGGFDIDDLRTDPKNFTGLVNTHHLPFPLMLDRTHVVADKLGGLTASQAILLDAKNRVVFSGAADDSKQTRELTGVRGKTKTYLEDAIQEVIAGLPVAVPYVQPKGCTIAK